MSDTVSLWRLARETATYQATDLSGIGAHKLGGRWNHAGIAVVYAAANLATAALELAVHSRRLTEIRDLYVIEIRVRASDWRRRDALNLCDLPKTWNSVPDSKSARDLGSQWLQERSELLLSVPSVVIPEERNVLINVGHAHMKHVSARVVRQFHFDPRLAKSR
jgi:RES domain-containing protein